MSKGVPIYSWDTSVFIAWLNEDPNAPLDDIHAVAEEIDAGKAALVLSVNVITELPRSKMKSDQQQLFDRFLKRNNVSTVDVSRAVSERARVLRDWGLSEKPVRKLTTTDCQIIATAIIWKCEVLHCLDGGGRKFGPCKLSGLPCVDNLRIVKPVPFSGQKSLGMSAAVSETPKSLLRSLQLPDESSGS